MVQVLDDQKRQRILAASAKLFSAKLFHDVTLDEIAAEAQVGKGTLYTYFKSKQNLYFSMLYDGFALLVDGLRRELSDDTHQPLETLRIIVDNFTAYALAHPHLFELTRTVGLPSKGNPDWARKRRELIDLIEHAIRKGVEAGQFEDTRPDWTAHYLSSMVRSVMLFGRMPEDPKALADHVFEFLHAGLTRKGLS